MNTAQQLVQDVHSAGGTVVAAGGKLKLSAPAPLPDSLIEKIRQHKAEVIGLLAGSQWVTDDWRQFYEERAAVLEYDGELDRAEAERQAFEATIIHWMNLTPPQNLDNDHCAQCGNPVGRIGNDAVPFLTGGGGHVWLHHGCHPAWMARRRREATDALNAMGIAPKTVI